MKKRIKDHYAEFDNKIESSQVELIINFDEIPLNSNFKRNYTIEIKGKRHAFIKKKS